MLVFEYEGLAIPIKHIAGVQLKGFVVEIFTAPVSHRIACDTEEEAKKLYKSLVNRLI